MSDQQHNLISKLADKIKAKLPEKESDTSLCLITASAASFFCTIGLVLMKFAHLKKLPIETSSIGKPVYCNPIWIVGIICLITGSLFNVIALNIGNQFLVSSTCCLSIIFNSLFSVYFLKEQIYTSDYVALSMIAVGCSLFMIEGKNQDRTYTNDEIYELYTRQDALIFYGISFAFISSSFLYEYFVVKQLKKMKARASTQQNMQALINLDREMESIGKYSPPSTPMTRASSGNFIIQYNHLVYSLGLISYMPNRRKYVTKSTLKLANKVKIPLIMLGTVCGLGGGLVSSFVLGFTLSMENKDGFSNPQTYVLNLVCSVFCVLQLFTLNRLMWLYQQIQIQPIFETSLIVFNLSCGAIIMKDYQLYTDDELVKMVGYMMICVLGVIVLIYKITWLNKICGHVDTFGNNQDQSGTMFKRLDQDDREYLQEAISKIEDKNEQREVQITTFLILNMEMYQEEVSLK